MQRRYLQHLGIEGTPSGLAGLREVVRKHVLRVPFENISKLLLINREGAGRFLTLGEFLDGAEQFDLGGTCHSANPFLGELLRSLSYHVDLLGADMSQPNVHTCLRVSLDGAAYHVDAGYGGPFREPVPLNCAPHEIIEGSERYCFDRNTSDGRLRLSGSEGPGYVVNDTPRSHDFFQPAMEGSFRPHATFLNCLRVGRIFENHSVSLLNRSLRIHRGGETETRELRNRAEVESAFANELAMPRAPWERAIDILEHLTGKAFFELTSSAGGSPHPH